MTLNSVDPKKLKSTDILEPSEARRRRTQVPMDSDLTFFDFDRDTTILKSLTGKVKDEFRELFKHTTGSSNLRISSAVSPCELVALCESLLELYESERFRDVFPDIQNITPVRDPEVISELNQKLLEALHARHEELYLAVPDVINYSDNFCVAFSGVGQSLIYDDVFLDRYYEYLESHKIALDATGLADLKKHRLILTDEEGATRQEYPIFKCFVYDTSLDAQSESYHLNDGEWFRVEQDFVAKIREYLNRLCEDLVLPEFSHENEGAYNQAVASQCPSYLFLDRTNIAPVSQTPVEPCDLLSVRDGYACLYHVKISTFSAKLSHLFNQGANSVQLLRLEPQAVQRLSSLIDQMAPDGEGDSYNQAVQDRGLHVVFAIITHKGSAARSDNLPLFSRISLMRVMKSLQLMSVKANFGFVRDASPQREGRRKERKKSETPESSV